MISQLFVPQFHMTNWNPNYRISEDIISQRFFYTNDKRNHRFQYIVFGYADTYFVQGYSDVSQK